MDDEESGDTMTYEEDEKRILSIIDGGKKKIPKPKRATLAKIESALSKMNITLNVFTEKIEMDGQAMDDSMAVKLRLQMERRQLMLCGKDITHDALVSVASEHAYDPITKYFESLKWDGEQRLDHWLSDSLGAAKNEYTSEIGKRFVVSAADRMLNPGGPHRLMLMLIGAEEVGKSLCCRDLCPREEWFTDYLPKDLQNREAMEALTGKVLIESSELASMRTSQQEAIKAFLSRPSDYYRGAYGHYATDHIRRCVIIGTTNDDFPIPDNAEWSRFWPVQVSEYNREWMRDNRDQLWAEAHELLKANYLWWKFGEGFKRLLIETREEFKQEDPWKEKIRQFLVGRDSVTTGECLGELDIEEKDRSRAFQMRIADVIRSLGLVKGRRVKIQGVNGPWLYVRKRRVHTQTETL